MKTETRSLILKIVLYQVAFLLLHFAYDWMPNAITRFFSGINESVFQHMKIGFYSYLVVALIEFLIMRKSIEKKGSFWVFRGFTASLIPFFLLFFYFIGPLIFVQFETDLGEIIFANIGALCSSLSAISVERQLEKAPPSKVFSVITLTLVVLWIAQFTVFTNRLPWKDVFGIPPGWE